MQVSLSPVQPGQRTGQQVHISVSADNQYLSADGLLNFSKLDRLHSMIQNRIKDQPEVKPVSIWVVARRAKLAPYSAASEKRGDLRYLTQRAPKIAARKRLKPESLARVKVLLTTYAKDALTDAQWSAQQLAVKAMTSHSKKAEKSLAKVSKVKTGIRVDEAKAFDVAAGALIELLKTSGLKDTAFVEAKSPFGSTVLVNLGNDNVVSVSKSNMARFRAAKKAAATGY